MLHVLLYLRVYFQDGLAEGFLHVDSSSPAPATQVTRGVQWRLGSSKRSQARAQIFSTKPLMCPGSWQSPLAGE